MRTEIVSIEELSDSREMLHAREPDFMIVFIIIILIIVITTFIWMWVGDLDITVQGNGILRPGQKVSIIRAINGGKVESVEYYEGKKVKKHAILFSIHSPELELAKKKLVEEKVELTEEAGLLEKLERSINEKENLFTVDNQQYYNRFLVYKYRLQQLKLNLTQAEDRFLREKTLSNFSTTKNRLEELENEYLITRLNLDKYLSETIVAIKDEKKEIKERLKEAENSLQKVNNGLELNNVKASIEGTIQVIKNFNSGDYIPAGVEVLKIIPDSGIDYRMEIIIQNKDIGHVKTGQKVKYQFPALFDKEYGRLEGIILKIPSDAVTGRDQSTASPVYKVEGSINRTCIFNKDGKTVQIKPGMVCDARIVIGKKRILDYVLEKLDFQ